MDTQVSLAPIDGLAGVAVAEQLQLSTFHLNYLNDSNLLQVIFELIKCVIVQGLLSKLCIMPVKLPGIYCAVRDRVWIMYAGRPMRAEISTGQSTGYLEHWNR